MHAVALCALTPSPEIPKLRASHLHLPLSRIMFFRIPLSILFNLRASFNFSLSPLSGYPGQSTVRGRGDRLPRGHDSPPGASDTRADSCGCRAPQVLHHRRGRGTPVRSLGGRGVPVTDPSNYRRLRKIQHPLDGLSKLDFCTTKRIPQSNGYIFGKLWTRRIQCHACQHRHWLWCRVNV